MVVTISASAAWPCTARAEAWISATGLLPISGLPTAQSRAFFEGAGYAVRVFGARNDDAVAGDQRRVPGIDRRQTSVRDIGIEQRQCANAREQDHLDLIRRQMHGGAQ
jgi:hypothetical protein